MLYATTTFSMVNSGNRTLRVPKRSWKIDLAVQDAENDRIVGMSHLDLKAMYNDPSQMREALAWRLFRRAG
ncbi:MAG: CotH kinase family protein, partial [Actinomycetota bacterium]|nr:CotH kinase family protein [Actinomycetota bacterium]